MKTTRCAVALVLAWGIAANAHGACTQANLAGKWSVYVQSNAGNNYAIACNVVVSSTGAITANNSTCAATQRRNLIGKRLHQAQDRQRL